MIGHHSIALRPVGADDADALYPHLVGSKVPDTLLWDGPESLDEYRRSLALLAEGHARGERFHFAIVFEKNRFTLEGTIRRAVRKRGRFVDEWLFGLIPEDLA